MTIFYVIKINTQYFLYILDVISLICIAIHCVLFNFNNKLTLNETRKECDTVEWNYL